MTDIVTYCDVNTCEDCPRYGDDCDGSTERLYTHKEAWGMTDLISRADAIEAIQNAYCKPCKERGDDHNEVRCRVCDYDNAIIQIDALPSADAEDRLYIKIYADDEPSVKAEKLYQICGETQNKEVAKWLKEYFPSTDAVQGEWEDKEVFNDTDDDHIVEEWQSARCSVCGKYHTTPYMYYFDNFNFCPNCGARMTPYKGGDTE